MTTKELHEKVMSDLANRGFRPARILQPDIRRDLRSPRDIASRLMGLNALFAWTAAPEQAVSSQTLKDYVNRNQLREWLTADEAAIMAMDRSDAHQAHVGSIGWKLENMWPLAWALGFDPAPGFDASQIPGDISRAIVNDMLLGAKRTIDQLSAYATPRSKTKVIVLEYRFYCAHNAVRSAQLGEDTVPDNFDPMTHGGAIHERRHALTWCLSPDVAWEDTELST